MFRLSYHHQLGGSLFGTECMHDVGVAYLLELSVSVKISQVVSGTVFIDWMYPSVTSADISWTAEFCILWAYSMKKSFACFARQQPVIELASWRCFFRTWRTSGAVIVFMRLTPTYLLIYLRTPLSWFPIRLLLTSSSYLSPFWKSLTCNFDDLELGQFQVIQGQRSWCQAIAKGWFRIRLPLTPSWYLSPF